MVISISALKGFLLEEALSKLLENSGYTLINREVLNYPDQYPEFVSRGNGLNIKGRGGTHQADVLGQFPISIPFNYPVRLFVEAKFRSIKTGIDVVRSGIGILTDLNANYQTIDLNGDELLIQRFNYQYAIFSTSGFSENAIKLAIAYKITLIDLRGNEYSDLLRTIDKIAYKLREVLLAEKISLNEVRKYIRYRLFNDKLSNDEHLRYRWLGYILESLFSKINEYGDLYLASVNSPFSFLIKPSSPEQFRTLIREYKESTFEVSIRWNYDEPNLWRIYLHDFRERELTFTFYLPELIENYVFNRQNSTEIIMNALNAKEQFFDSMVFYMRSAEKFITFKYREDVVYQ